MPFILIIKEEARLDILDAYTYYEDKQEALGNRFLIELQAKFNGIVSSPEYYSFTDSQKILRDCALSISPFVIVYRIVESEIRIYAVMHTSRKPNRYLI